jgi:hypothetical protein
VNRPALTILAFVSLIVALTSTAGSAELFDQNYRRRPPEAGERGTQPAWQVVSRQGVPALESSQPGAAMETALRSVEDRPVSTILEYGWRAGRGAGAAELRLTGADERSVRILLKQGSGRKYEIRADDASSLPLATLDDPTLDAGVTAGGVADSPAVVHVNLAAGGKRLTLSRLGGRSVSVDLSHALQPVTLSVRDASRGAEHTRIYRLRAFVGAIDPVKQPVEFSMPFGASFVQGREVPTLRLLGRWFSDETRAVRLTLSATALPAAAGEVATPVELTADLPPGQRMELRVDALGAIPPGLYRLRGELTVGQQEQPVDARFAVLDPDLADRPQEQIPQWMGIVPFINVLPREAYPESFSFMHKLGVRHVRWLPGWGRLEPEEGQYEWDESDQFMDLVRQHQMQAMFCLSYYGGDWADAKTNGQLARTPEGRQMWVERFAVPTIRRYGDRVKLWQIWNEPDAFWNEDPEKAEGFAKAFATPANYFDLLKRTHIAAHDLGIPGLRIMASLSSGDIPRSTRTLFDLGLGKHFDGMIIHTYGHHVRHFQLLRKQLTDLGHANPALGSGESGLPRAGDWDSAIKQAQRVVHQFFSSTTIPNLLCVEHFVLHDGVAGGNFGIVNDNMQPHPAALAYFTTARLLAGARSGSIDTRGTLTVYRVERDGRPPVVALVNAGTPALVKLAVNGDQPPVLWTLLGQRKDAVVQGGTLTLDVADAAFVEGDVTVRETVAPALAVSVDTDARVSVVVSVGGSELAGTPVHLQVAELRVDQRLALDASGQVRFVLPQPLAGNHRYPAALTIEIPGAQLRQETFIEATPIYQVTDAQAEWLEPPAHLPALELDKVDAFRPFNPRRAWGGIEDNSAELRLGWTEERLVLWVAQRDDEFTPASDAAPNPFGYDSVQWAFQPEGQLAPGAATVDITAGLLASGKQAVRVLGQPHYKPTGQIRRTGTLTRYRITMPLTQLGIEAKAGASFGTAINLNDNDGDGRKGWLYWGNGINPPKDPALFRRVVLMNQPPQTGDER